MAKLGRLRKLYSDGIKLYSVNPITSRAPHPRKTTETKKLKMFNTEVLTIKKPFEDFRPTTH